MIVTWFSFEDLVHVAVETTAPCLSHWPSKHSVQELIEATLCTNSENSHTDKQQKLLLIITEKHSVYTVH